MATNVSFFSEDAVKREAAEAIHSIAQQHHIPPTSKELLPGTPLYACIKEIFNVRNEYETFSAFFYGEPERENFVACFALNEGSLVWVEKCDDSDDYIEMPTRVPLSNVLQVNIEDQTISFLYVLAPYDEFDRLQLTFPSAKDETVFRKIWQSFQEQYDYEGIQLAPIGNMLPLDYEMEKTSRRCLPVVREKVNITNLREYYCDMEITLENCHSRVGSMLRRHPWRNDRMTEEFKEYVKTHKGRLQGKVLSIESDERTYSTGADLKALVFCFALDGYDEDGKAIFNKKAFEKCMMTISEKYFQSETSLYRKPIFYIDLRNISGANWEEIYSAINRMLYVDEKTVNARIYVRD